MYALACFKAVTEDICMYLELHSPAGVLPVAAANVPAGLLAPVRITLII